MNKKANIFKIEIGTVFEDDKRNITTTDREYRDNPYNEGKFLKWYKYKCNICGWTEGWVIENHLKNRGCACCSGKNIVLGINTIWDTDTWMIPIIGEECAKTHTHGSNAYIYPTCPDCGRVKNKKMKICTIHKSHSMFCSCNDGTSIGEKAMFNILEQLGVNFEHHKTFDWSKSVQVDNPKLCGNKEYDFYFILNNEQFLIETHGNQHYEEGFGRIKSNKKARTLKEEVENDKNKKELALINGILEKNYIVIDCRKSELNFIIDNIINNDKLNKLFDMDNIKINRTKEFAVSSRVKEVCELWNTIHDIQIICKITKLTSPTTIRKYLKVGTELGYCVYNAIEEHLKGSLKGNTNRVFSEKQKELISKANSKKVICLTTEKVFDSITQGADFYNCNRTHIGDCCKGKRKTCGELEDGTLLFWLYYDEYLKLSKQEIESIEKLKKRKKSKIKNITKSSKGIICLENKMIFITIAECERRSEELFGTKLDHSPISAVCSGKKSQYKGFTFRYILDLSEEEYIKYNIENKLK